MHALWDFEGVKEEEDDDECHRVESGRVVFYVGEQALRKRVRLT